MQSLHAIFMVLTVSLGGRVAFAAQSAPTLCVASMYTDDAAESKCATNSSYDQCRTERDACFAANPLKKKPCITAARACGAGVVALRKEAAQCRWRSRMKKVFANNDNTDAVKAPCKVQLKNLRKDEQADASKLNIQFMTETNSAAAQN